MSNEFITIALIHLLAVASPGPDFAVVVRHSMHFGKRIAIVTSLGIGLAILVHVAYSILGLSLLIATTPWLFSAVKIIAAAYLLYLGVNALKSKPVNASYAEVDKQPANDSNNAKTISAYRAFFIGFITNGINPKATLFFLSLFTLVIAPNTSLTIKLFYGGYLSIATAVWFCLLSYLLDIENTSMWLRQYSYWVDRAMGLLLIVVAVNILLFDTV